MLLEKKDEIRKIYLQKRASISEKERKLKNREIVKNFYSNIAVKPKSVIAFYKSLPTEVDLSLLLEMYQEDGHTICLPCVEEKDSPLIFRKYSTGLELELNNKYGIYQPPKKIQEVLPNVIIIPIVAFDSVGTRIGMGGGFYDRTLEYFRDISAEFIAVGIAYACQQTPFIRPEAHDQKLDCVVTENKVFVF